MSQHEQVNKVNTDGKRSNYGRQPSCKQFRVLEREEGSLKLEKHFIEVLEEKASTTEAGTAGETNFSFTFQLCKGHIPTDEKACDSQMA